MIIAMRIWWLAYCRLDEFGSTAKFTTTTGQTVELGKPAREVSPNIWMRTVNLLLLSTLIFFITFSLYRIYLYIVTIVANYYSFIATMYFSLLLSEKDLYTTSGYGYYLPTNRNRKKYRHHYSDISAEHHLLSMPLLLLFPNMQL